jgi:hypothetical protein
MKIAKFTYKDLKGKVTERKVLVVSEPTNKVSGIDIGELEAAEQQEFAEAYQQLLNTFVAEVSALKAAWDVKHNYRQFIADRMTNTEYS